MADSPYVVAVTASTFDSVVIEGSFERPVLVDFWADWCAPCRMLMPILAKLADEHAGKFLVAKVNTEEEQALAAEFGVRSLPTVQIFKDGRAVDQFMGALPEGQVREILERHLPRESDPLLAQAEGLLAGGDLDGARSLIEQARAKNPENPRLYLTEIRIKAVSGDTRGAEEMLERVPLEIHDDPEVVALRGQLRFANLVADAPPEAELAGRLATNPDDSEARYQIAAHRAARGDYEGALEALFALLKKDRAWGDDAARKGMLMVFDLLGGEGELVSRYRAKMLSALY
jgi:putative thioredoxin